MVAIIDPIRVSALPADAQRGGKATPDSDGTKLKPAHWVNGRGREFRNPWPSFHAAGLWDVAKMLRSLIAETPAIPNDIAARIPVVKPTWGLGPSDSDENNEEKIKATWLGHACFLVELPMRPTAGLPKPVRGARILFDPVFSERCAPSQSIGPRRFTKIPCEIDEIPEIDAIVISHNHYDHLDTHTITKLSKRARPPHVFAPLGNAEYFRSIGVPSEQVHILDWWEGRRVEAEVPSTSDDKNKPALASNLSFDVTCTPAQHRTGRGVADHFKSLWASWVVQEVRQVPSSDSSCATASAREEGVKVYFAGDTGYRSVRAGKAEDEVPTCPAFKEIGARWGGFDFAMIPIGAYKPRDFMSTIHCAPQDSVQIFKDIRAKKALGMHWGTWVLTTEDVLEPPIRLAEECKKVEIPEGDFDVCDIGQTMFF